jgi:L-threonylcarbamoyladenylate synthase
MALPGMSEIEQAVEVLKSGGVVVFPTSTSYGLAADAANANAVKKLYQLKGRDFKNPIHVIAKDLGQAQRLVKFNSTAKRMAKEFWPGPLTLVLPLKKSGASWKLLSAGTKTLGIRVPDHPIITGLLNVFGRPITATSANLSGKPQAYSIAEAKKQFNHAQFKPDFYLDGGVLEKTKPSTIIQIDGRHVTLLREGPLEFHYLIKFLQ